MSSIPAFSAPRTSVEERARLSPVPFLAARLQTRPKMGYAIIVTAVVFGIFLAQLLLSIALSGGAYQITALQGEQRVLARTTSALNEQLQTVGSTQNLAANARALGMVNDSTPAFLRLSDGRVIGAAAVAAKGSTSTKIANGATGSVPNSLLADVPVVTVSSSGHGASNADSSSSTSTESNGGAPVSPGTPDSQNAASGDLPSPTTH